MLGGVEPRLTADAGVLVASAPTCTTHSESWGQGHPVHGTLAKKWASNAWCTSQQHGRSWRMLET